ncbi:MAG: PaaI family thioesterase [Kiloniellales bacterium]|nr:PaaI family thioesterase [Kiloniellales bacterium]
MSKITVQEIREICAKQLPFALELGMAVESLDHGEVTVRLPYRDEFVRPGGTVAGPMLMTLADFAMYVAVLSRIGRQEMAVTSNLNCNFLRRPRPADVVAHARIIKLGKRLAYGEVSMFSEGEEDGDPVAHATVTYSVPPREAGENGDRR